jgi:hypothetical protein
MNDPAWIRRRPERTETGTAAVAALAVAAGTAAVTFWLVRTLLARDPVTLRPERLPPEEARPGRLP